VVGGSVLYVKAILDQFDFPATDPIIRARYENLLDEEGPGKLHELLAEKDPITASNILPGNGRRIVRALEVIEITGEPYHSRLPEPTEEISSVRIGLEIDRVSMDARIMQRVDHMLDLGLVAEVEQLEIQGLRNAPTASRAIGYSQVLAHLSGELSSEEMREKIIYATQKFMRDNSDVLLVENIDVINGHIHDIQNAIDAKNRDAIVTHTDYLNMYSREFAEKAMDKNIAKALQGKKIE
jgi:tRNA dimethylallyltransferase